MWFTMYFMDENEKKEYQTLNEIEFQKQLKEERENPNFMSWHTLVSFWNLHKPTKYHPNYSYETLIDFFTISLTLGCGIYT